MPNEPSELKALLSELEKLATDEEKQAYILENFSKKEKETPQVIGLPEHGAADGAEPCV